MRKTSLLRFRSLNTRIFSGLVAVTAMMILLSSCGTAKQTGYFIPLQNKDTTVKTYTGKDFESKIMKGDRISVLVSSLSPAEDLLFNSPGLIASTGMTTGNASVNMNGPGGYTVQEDGTITLHRLGKIKAEGSTRRELANRMETLLLPYMKEPIVQISYLNHRITVIGQVGTPQILSMTEDHISILDALVLSGDVTATADRKNVTIIREEGGEKKVKHVNLEDNSVFSSPWYYLQPNDIVMVNQDKNGTDKAEKSRRLQTTLSLIASGVSLLIIVLDRVIK